METLQRELNTMHTTYTLQTHEVAKLIRKIKYNGSMAFTYLHPNEEELLTTYILEYEPNNDTVKDVISNNDYDVYQLASIAEMILIEQSPEYPIYQA